MGLTPLWHVARPFEIVGIANYSGRREYSVRLRQHPIVVHRLARGFLIPSNRRADCGVLIHWTIPHRLLDSRKVRPCRKCYTRR